MSSFSGGGSFAVLGKDGREAQKPGAHVTREHAVTSSLDTLHMLCTCYACRANQRTRRKAAHVPRARARAGRGRQTQHQPGTCSAPASDPQLIERKLVVPLQNVHEGPGGSDSSIREGGHSGRLQVRKDNLAEKRVKDELFQPWRRDM